MSRRAILDELVSMPVDPLAVAQILDLDARRTASGNVSLRCPFHDDARASGSLYNRGQGVFFRCFGCGLSLNLIGFLQKLKGRGAAFTRTAESLHEQLRHLIPISPTASEPARDLVAEALLSLSPASKDEAVAAYLMSRGLPMSAYFAAIPSDAHTRSLLADVVRTTVGELSWATSPNTDGDDFWTPQYPLLIAYAAPDGSVYGTSRRSINPAADPRYLTPPGARHLWPFGIADLPNHRVPLVVIVEGAFNALAYHCLTCEAQSWVPTLGVPSAAMWPDEWTHAVTADVVQVGLDDDRAGHLGAARIKKSFARFSPETRLERIVSPSWGDWAEELLHV